ncbi:MAG: helix-turn-helix domain-containing protein [Leptospirales bacterium]|nr:helix-turn-helix domain-containing protein [Leptospirales bacterium]
MAGDELPYFKFVAAIIESGLWARMSSAARTLYPVLLRFSDRSYKSVFPGGRRLLELTGFKQKSTLRKARQELVELGLLSITTGNGRRTTHYSFRFDQFQRGESTPPSGAPRPPSAEHAADPRRGGAAPSPVFAGAPPYNQIQISINHHPSGGAGGEQSRVDHLGRRFGAAALQQARNECELAGLPPSATNLESILYRADNPRTGSWTHLETMLASKISAGSMALIRNAFLGEREGLLVFADDLPGQLKILLERCAGRIFFEPVLTGAMQTRKDYWQERSVD